ncbi:MAG: GDSL-type esterase/lipase family protein [bacterium]|nr:GDSL-type esterase/lipase family protein [bacterium]
MNTSLVKKTFLAIALAVTVLAACEIGLRVFLRISESDTAYRLKSTYRRFQVDSYEHVLDLHYPKNVTITQKVTLAPHPNKIDRLGRPVILPGAPVVTMKYKTNSLGFRDIEFSDKKEGTERVVCIGDSVTFGDGVTMEQTYAKVLEQKIRKRGENWQVINAGSQGLTSIAALHMIKRRILPLNPKTLIYCLCVNDDAPAEISDFEYLSRVIHRAPLLRFLDNFYCYIVWKQWMNRLRVKFLGRGRKTPSQRHEPAGAPPLKLDRRVTINLKKQNINSLISLCRKRGINLLLMTPPMTSFGMRDRVTPHIKVIKSLAVTREVPMIDLYSIFPKREQENGLVFKREGNQQKLLQYTDGKENLLMSIESPHDSTIAHEIFYYMFQNDLKQTTVIDQVHPTPIGHELIANLLIEQLERLNLLR